MSRKREPGACAGFVIAAALCLFVSTPAQAEERITFKSANGDKLEAVYFAPASENAKPAPSVVMLHGCSGLFTKSGKIKARERMWIELVQKEGWAVLLPDSFGPRGLGSQCQTKDRAVTPGDRQFDARGALDYLLTKPGIDPKRVALFSWSNGAMTGLKVVRDGSPAGPANGAPDFKVAVLYYPGCIAEKKENPSYKARIPTLIQHGAEDDWTLAKPCLELVQGAATRGGAPMFMDIYPGAYHDFDHPTSKLKTIVTRLSGYPGGEKTVHVGANPEAREKSIPRTMDWLRAHLTGD